MKLKSIEVIGFKSFPRRLKLELSDHITVMVGPNGCGKSNICDAFVWALGEQSPRLLRSQRMQDVIFSGTEEIKPINYSQVSMHFAGASDWLKVGFDEIVISRKMFRSGESEFLINQAPCRLRDIQELFMDTGVGARSYSVIPQSQVTELIDQKPPERRLIIEEAAGIQKYRHRKKLAVARLAETEDNLVRVDQRIVEISRNTKTLKAQSEKAQEFRDLQMRHRELKMRLNCVEYVGLSEKLARERGKLASDTQAQTELLEQLKLSKSDREEAEVRFTALSKEKAEVENCLSEARREAETLRVSTGLLTEKIRSENERAGTCRDDIQELQTQVERTQKELQQLTQNRERVQTSLTTLNEEMRSIKQVCDDSRQSQMKLSQRLSSLQNERMSVAAKLARAEEEQKSNSLAAERLSKEHMATAERAAGLEAESHKLEAKLELAESELLRCLKKQASCKEVGRASDKALSDALKAKDDALQRRDLVASRLTQTQSRLQTTRELLSQLEGFQEGIRAIAQVWQERSAQKESPEVVGHLLHVKEGFETPLEAVLGPRLQCLVMEDLNQVTEAVGYLKEHEAGRGSFLAKQAIEARPPSKAAAPVMSGTLGSAQSFVESCSYPPLLDMLLHDVWVVEDLGKALSLWEVSTNGATFVTLSGEVVEKTGMVHGGAGVPGTRVLTRRRELLELERSEKSLASELQAAERAMSEASRKATEAREAASKAQQQVHAAEIELLDKQRVLDDLKREHRLVEADLKGCNDRMRSIKEAKDKQAAREKELVEDIGLLRQQGAEQERLVGELRSLLADSTRQSASQEKQLAELGQKKAAGEEKKRSLAANIERTEASLRETAEKKQQKERLVERIGQDVIELRREQTKSAKRLAELEKSCSVQDSHLKSMSHEQSELAARRETLRRGYDDLIERERQISSAVSSARERASSLEAQLQASLERIEGEMSGFPDVDGFDAILEQYGRREPIDAQTRDEMRAELKVISSRLDGLEDVNFAAIQDYKSAKDELDFLREQRADIAQSVRLINRTIGKIDAEAQRRFTAAFDAISEKFQARFADLFGGGSAGLQLVGSDDVLEAGVEIVAQPPGKRRMSIGLLSGGEKALAGIALTFALFEYRPAPVCILDEIDAALDEGNTARFIERVRYYSQRTQFLIITHNRRTMEMADILYGVTMEKKGVSKVLKLRMEDLTAEADAPEAE